LSSTVTYVALGPHRIRAAEQHAARLAADGAQVHLVVADRPESAELKAAPGVSVHRVAAASSRSAAAAAVRLAVGRDRSLPVADLLVAGDVEALPVAWAAHRRHPDLTVRFEPEGDPARRPAPADLAVVTPWYPSPNSPFVGSFVQSATQAVQGAFQRVSVLHTQEWTVPKDLYPRLDEVGLMADRFTAASGNAVVADWPEGEVTRACVPVVTSGAGYRARAAEHVKRLAAALPTGQIEAPLVHAHTGIYGGVVAAELARPDARIVVTEHATFLPRVFGDRASRRRYEQMLERVDVLMCVSEHMRDLVQQWFPRYRDKLRVVPNVVDFDAFALRPRPPRDLLRWLYLGRMTQHKGVLLLLDAFARVAAEEPRATLSLVGAGELEDTIRRRVQQSGLVGRVELRPPVPLDEVAQLLREHDLLVHASQVETFGLTIVESVATGTPVLVARSEGPAETLAGLDGVAGGMFGLGDDPGLIVDGFRELRARLSTLDPVAARQTMLSRYGRQTVRAVLLEAYRPGPRAGAVPARSRSTMDTAGAAGPAAARLVLIATGPANPGTIKDFTRAMTEQGYGVDLVTADQVSPRWVADDDRVRVYSVESAEARRLVMRAERLLVFKVPGKVISVALALARRRRALWPELAVLRAQHLNRRVARFVHLKVFRRCYNVVRPLILWRIARREVLPQLDLAKTGRVVVSGASGVAIGWRLARRYPDLTVTTSMSVSFDD
jgi:glycosyltransferase involved in cell wall biosynthesis